MKSTICIMFLGLCCLLSPTLTAAANAVGVSDDMAAAKRPFYAANDIKMIEYNMDDESDRRILEANSIEGEIKASYISSDQQISVDVIESNQAVADRRPLIRIRFRIGRVTITIEF